MSSEFVTDGPTPVEFPEVPGHHTHNLEHLLFVNDEILLFVEHDADWLSEDENKPETFLTLLKQRECPGLPESNASVVSEVQLTRNDSQPVTLFPVKWKNGPGVGERLEDLNNFLERNDKRVDVSDTHGRRAALTSVVPNWYVGASGHTGLGTHGPALPPRPAPNARGTGKRVDRAPVAAQPQATSNKGISSQPSALSDIDVYILDTVPPATRIENAWNKWGLSSSPDFTPLFEFYEKIVAPTGALSGGYKTLQADYHYAAPNAFADTHSPVLRDPDEDARTACKKGIEDKTQENYEPYELYDHGFFIAGIVHRRVPEAKLVVIQVLNDYGVGTFLSIAAGFRKVAELRAARGNNAIINCSFTLSLPTASQIEMATSRSCVAKLYPDLTALVAAVDVARLVDETICLLHAIISSVETGHDGKKAVIVACAGNDSARPNKEANTGSPAALSDVFPDYIAAVGALKTETAGMKVASYSNKLPASGLLAFGGEYAKEAKDAKDDDNGIVSIYSKETVSGGPNTHGLAEWAGTSFATPIVASEIALQCRDTGKDPVEALQAVRTSAAGRVPAGYVDVSVSPA